MTREPRGPSRRSGPTREGRTKPSCGPRPWVTILLAALTIACLAPAEAASQSPFTLRLGRGEFGFQGQGSVRDVGPRTGTDETWGQWMRLPVDGHLLHPRVLRYLVTVSPRFTRHSVSSLDGDSRTRDLGTDVTLQLFQGRRLSFNVQNVRSSGRSEGAFGSTGDFRSNSSTATATLRHRYFPIVARYQRHSIRDAWSSAYTPGPVVRDQTERKLLTEVRNKKLLTSLSYHSKEDHRGTDDFDARTLQFNHTLEWGEGSSLRSSFIDFDREGARAIRQRTFSEKARIQHTGKVASDLFWSTRAWSRADGPSSGSRNMGARLTVDPSTKLQLSIMAGAQRIEGRGADADRLDRKSVTPTAAFATGLPLRVRFNGRVSVGLERIESDGAGQREIDVIDEAHRLDDGLRVRLDPVGIDLQSIDVWNEDRSVHLQLDVDYRLVEIGDLVEIQVLPGGRVGPGDGLLVSYRYTVSVSRRSEYVFQNYEGALIRDGFSLRYGHRERSEEVFEAGGLEPEGGSRETWAGVGYAGNTPLGGLRVDLFRRTRITSGLRVDSRGADVQLDLPMRGPMRFGVRGSIEEVDARDGRSVARTAGATLSWALSRSLRLRSGVRAFGWDRPGAHTEDFLSNNSMLTWTWGSVHTVITYDFSRRWNGDRRTNHHWSLRVVRRF